MAVIMDSNTSPLVYTKVPEKKALDHIRARFSDAPWMEYLKGIDVIVVGAGGIGSWVTLCLSRIGCEVTLFDGDIFEDHNMGGQLVQTDQIGDNKAEAVSDICVSLVGPTSIVYAEQQMYTEDSFTGPIMISAVDSMKARKIIFDKWSEVYKEAQDAIFIDGRLLAEDYQVYAVTHNRTEEYRKTLFNDNEVPTENCTLKATTHCSLGIASDIIGILTNFAANIISKRTIGVEVRDVPFRIVKSIPNFMYDITFETNDNSKERNDDNKERDDNPGDVRVHAEELLSV